MAEATLAAGEGTQLDVTTLKAEQATANIDLREASRKLNAAHIALAHRLGHAFHLAAIHPQQIGGRGVDIQWFHNALI